MNEKQKQSVIGWLEAYPGSTTCVRQIWYECLLGNGVPDSEMYASIEGILIDSSDWDAVGSVRYEKMGPQPSYRRKVNPEPVKDGRIMVQHMFGLGKLWRDPDGKVLKVVLSEVFNIRCFEIKDGKMTGPMIRFDPRSDYAKSLREVVQ